VPHYRDGIKEPSTIFEAAAFKQRLKVVCQQCQRASVFDPHQLWWLFDRKGWSGIFGDAVKRFWCRRCAARVGRKVKRARIELTADEPTITLPSPGEYDWKRAVSRFRG